MRVVLVSRYPRVDTLEWKQRVGAGLLAAGAEVSLLYSHASLLDQAWAGLREDGLGVVRRYLALRGGGTRERPTRSLEGWATERGLEVQRVRRLSETPMPARQRPDLLVLVGADLVPGSLLAVPRLGTINAHYGMLPAYRGMNVTEWSVFNGDPVGVTIHLVDPGIDTGPVLLQERIALEPGDTFATLRRKHQDLSARLLVEAAMALRDGTAHPRPQTADGGRQYFRMHPALRRVAEERLRAQTSRSADIARGARSLAPDSAASASISPSATWASHQRK